MRQPKDSGGLRCPDFENWDPSLLAAFAKADTTERAAVKEEMVALRDLVVELLADLRATKG